MVLCLINLKVFCGGSWVVEGTPFFLDCSFERQFDSSSCTLRETIDKWVLLMRGVRKWRGAISQIKLQNCKFSYLCGLLLHNCNSNKMRPCITFSGIKEKSFDSSTLFYICLHSSSDWSTFVYTCLLTRLSASILF